MSEVTKLLEEYLHKVNELQETCPHEEVTDWYNPRSPFGYLLPHEQRTCKRCDKVIEQIYPEGLIQKLIGK